MKSSGFDVGKTHLKDIQRIKKLLLLVIFIFVWCCKMGIHLHQKKPILIKKNTVGKLNLYSNMDLIS
nr:hypothetical protein [Polaribacter batillariae]